jgi:hypothetical protein
MAQYKRKGDGNFDGIAKFIAFTKVYLSWIILKLKDYDEPVIL